MKYHIILLWLFTMVSQALYAQSNGLSDGQRLIVDKLIRAASAGDKRQIAAMVVYPLRRTYPLSDVKNKAEMLARFDTIFDGELLRRIARSKTDDWSVVGWRGLMLDNGALWMDDAGGITAINYQSEKEKVLLERAIQKDKQQLPSSLQQLATPLYRIITKHYRIRIDELAGGQWRYACWSLKSAKKDADLVLYNGVFEAQGSGGNHTITFANGLYRYVVSINRLGTRETPEAVLTVFKEATVLLNDPGKITRN
ncbi:hypothetical protein LQ567_09935 [Niabella pedocola]|uniref:Uncharacterized protein n=1 Tax=Niabella pedocola TaxID=1752077 RepID=A0ABS8PPR6_9BACT|nr:hypothetical protein [Niabella pedocola]MCD2423082.1 hypothetical protein [Niabella pedocola]